jgi:hypothetical protein
MAAAHPIFARKKIAAPAATTIKKLTALLVMPVPSVGHKEKFSVNSWSGPAMVSTPVNPTITATSRTTNPTMTIMPTPLILVIELRYTGPDMICAATAGVVSDVTRLCVSTVFLA